MSDFKRRRTMADERVVVVAPLECKTKTSKPEVHCVRIRGLGLTAYGDTREEAVAHLRKMFATFVELNRRSGTLEERLNKSKLQWCYESEYEGSKPAEMVKPNGTITLIKSKRKKDDENHWDEEKELVLAR
jgi:hypothetical protein